MINTHEHRSTAISALENFMQINPERIERSVELGDNLKLTKIATVAVEATKLFGKISLETIDLLPDSQLRKINKNAKNLYKTFLEARNFSSTQPDAEKQRAILTDRALSYYSTALEDLAPIILLSGDSTLKLDQHLKDSDERLERFLDDRALDNAETKALLESSKAQYETHSAETRELIEELRSALAEHGVSKQSQYYGAQADEHAERADKWGRYTLGWALGVGAIALASLLTSKWAWLSPDNTGEAIQLITSKLLFVGMFTFMLVRSSRIYQAHKHNEVINRHKQNSLLTYDALVEAGSHPEIRNTVLNHAAASIYSTPDSGYVKSRTDTGGSNNTIVEALPRIMNQASDGS